ncbi:MAG TPA: outer membrane lipoprotein carrier protein LolA [Candidatus Polarisedimenticolia bacterium]|nr:outer membrane lipoprotein carrier protein LolA [Candidatus Polarisedimenticolia bacterium]
MEPIVRRYPVAGTVAIAILLVSAHPATAAPGGTRAETQDFDAAALSEARLLSAALNSLTGLTAAFTQTVESAALPSPQIERGIVYLLRPGRMRFEYLVPKGKLAIADGRRTILYLPEDRQVVTAPLDARETRSGIGLLLEDPVDLVSEFSVAWDRPAGPAGARILRLTPRSGAAEYQFLLVETDADHLVRTLTVVDPLGSRVTYRFEHVTRVATLDPSLFSFTVPKGVAVQDAGR